MNAGPPLFAVALVAFAAWLRHEWVAFFDAHEPEGASGFADEETAGQKDGTR